ncbi:urease accessory protein UreD [Luteococcus sediminum]
MTSLGFRKAERLPEVAGTLNLVVSAVDGRSGPVHTEHSGVLRLMHALHLDDSGQVTYVVVNPGGAYFGETYHLKAEVRPGANLLLAAQGATRIYRTPKEPAVQLADFRVGAGARFEYVPEQTIAYKDANYRQVTRLVVAPDAQAFVGEVVTPGWAPDGSHFAYAGMRLRLDVLSEDGNRVCTDNVSVTPSQIGEAISGVGYLEGCSHMGSALVVGPQTASPGYVDQVREAVDASGLQRVGVTTGRRHGIDWLMLRGLADSTQELTRLVLDVNEIDRKATTGQARLDLRRY